MRIIDADAVINTMDFAIKISKDEIAHIIKADKDLIESQPIFTSSIKSNVICKYCQCEYSFKCDICKDYELFTGKSVVEVDR